LSGFSILSVKKLSKEEVKQKGSESTKLMINMQKIEQILGATVEETAIAWPVRISASKKQ